MSDNPITHIPKFKIDSTAEELWEIVELARQDFERCTELIQSLDRKSLIRLYWNYSLLHANFIWEPYRIEDYSDGLNIDIGHWVIGQGQEYCSQVLADPKLVPHLEELSEDFDLEPRIINIMHREYGKRYHKILPELDNYPDKFWELIDLGIESLERLSALAKKMKPEELLEFIRIYEAARQEFEESFIHSLSRHKIELQSLNYTVRELSQWVVAQGREDFCDYLENIVRDYSLPLDLTDPKMAVLDVVVQECEKRYENYLSDEFWEFLTLARQDFNLLTQEVKQMKREKFIQFSNDLYGRAIPTLGKSLELYAPDINFDIDAVCVWVIARGKKFYAQTVANSNSIPKLIIEEIEESDPQVEFLNKVSELIFNEYENRFDEELGWEFPGEENSSLQP